jgi:hypothetical protein
MIKRAWTRPPFRTYLYRLAQDTSAKNKRTLVPQGRVARSAGRVVPVRGVHLRRGLRRLGLHRRARLRTCRGALESEPGWEMV